MLVLARKAGEKIVIGDGIVISVIEVKGEVVRLGFEAPSNIKVYRHEVFQSIQEENKKAAQSASTGAAAALPQLPSLPIKSTLGSAKKLTDG